MEKDKLSEVFPVLNLSRIERKEYLMNVYLNAVKVMARRREKTKRISKDSKKVLLFYGINTKEIIIFNNRISTITDTNLNLLNKSFVYFIAQILYESIENDAFTIELATNEEKCMKIVKYYISKSYPDYREFILDYLTCNKKRIEKNVKYNLGIDLQEIEEELKRV